MRGESPLVRQWILLRSLCARRYGATVKELAEELRVNEKTVRRDLAVFHQAGFPLQETVEEFGRKRWRIESARPGLAFTFDEAAALYLGRRFLEPLAGTPFWEAAQRAFRKIRGSLRTDALKYVERFANMFHQTAVGTSDYSKKAELIDQLMLGIEDRRAVFLTYRSLRTTEAITYDVYPYGLIHHRGSLYLIGWSVRREEIRHWKVDRIQDAEATQVHFQRPEGFDLRDHLAESFGIYHGKGEVRVTIRFSPTVARYVEEKTWHSSQKLTAEQGGGLIARFRLSNTEEIKRWILSFGRHAEVLEPPGLRAEVLRELRPLLRYYEEPSSGRARQATKPHK